MIRQPAGTHPGLTRDASSSRRDRSGRRRLPRQSGFTLIELLVSMIVFVTVLVAVMVMFTSSSRLARLQIHTADMQQSLRIGQYEIVRNLRMAGRGGLPTRQFPTAVPA